MGSVRKIVAVALAGAVSLTLSGCLGLDLTTSVSPSATFTGAMTMTFDKAAVAEFGVMDLSAAQEQLGAPDVTTDNVSIEWSQTDEDYLQTISFQDATPDQIEEVTTSATEVPGMGGDVTSTTSVGFPLDASVRDGHMVVKTTEQAGKAGSDAGMADGETATAELVRSLFGDSAVDISVTMPGDITEVSGVLPAAARAKGSAITLEQAARTVTLSAPFADLAVLEDKVAGGTGLLIRSDIDASAPTPSASPTVTVPPATVSGDSDAPPSGLLISIGVVVALVVVGAGLLVARNRTPRTDAESPAAGDDSVGGGP